MNANELADGIESCTTDLLHYKAATMLRQQAKELDEAGHMIGVLREQLQEEIQARADALDDLNSRMMKFMKSYNEMAYKLEEVGGAYTHPVKEQGNPVAWRSQDPDGYWSVYQSPVEGAEPLYTGLKELTDEEIIKTMVQFDVYSSDDHCLIEAGRAILRKASEK